MFDDGAVEEAEFAAGGEGGADFLEGFLGAEVVDADFEEDGVDELEGVGEHEAFEFAVVAAAPVGAGEEGSADFDFGNGGVALGVAGGADDFLGLVVDDDEGAFGGEGGFEELFEEGLLVARGDGVLFPDFGVGGDGEEGGVVGEHEGAEGEEGAGEGGLEGEGGHGVLRAG